MFKSRAETPRLTMVIRYAAKNQWSAVFWSDEESSPTQRTLVTTFDALPGPWPATHWLFHGHIEDN